MTVNDAFRPVSRYFDRIMRPEQLLTALPRAFATMTDPADCGPVTLAFCQDVQAEAYDWPAEFFAPKEWHRRRPRPGLREVKVAADAIRGARAPADHRRRRRALRRGHRRAAGLRREAQHPRRRDPGRQVVDALGPPAEPRLDRRHRLGRHQRRRRGGRRRSSASAPGCRTSPPAPGRCSRARTAASSRSTSPPTTPTSTTPCRWSPTPASRSTRSPALLGDHRAPDIDADAQGRLDRRRRQGHRRARPATRCRPTCR